MSPVIAGVRSWTTWPRSDGETRLAAKRRASPSKTASAKRRASARHPNAKQRSSRGLLGKLTENALLAAVAGALIAGIAGYLIADHQDQDSASQVRSSQQAKSADQRASSEAQSVSDARTAAEALYSSATAVYSFQRECAIGKTTWRQCASMAPSRPQYVTDANAFIPDIYNLTDQAAINVAAQFSGDAADAILASSSAAGKQHWSAMVNAYLELLSRCAQLTHGH